ncbi:MAG: hypothetical protein ABEJ74_04260 [Haloferacaceae archaeon]
MDDRGVDPRYDHEEIEAPLGTGPHMARTLETIWPWDVYVCDRCGHKAWFRTDGYERFACSGDPEVDPADREGDVDGADRRDVEAADRASDVDRGW